MHCRGKIRQRASVYKTFARRLRAGRTDKSDFLSRFCKQRNVVQNRFVFFVTERNLLETDVLPEGYNTMLTRDGENLSQGQRQLLAIARAAVADPPVYRACEYVPKIRTSVYKHKDTR